MEIRRKKLPEKKRETKINKRRKASLNFTKRNGLKIFFREVFPPTQKMVVPQNIDFQIIDSENIDDDFIEMLILSNF